MEMTMEIAERTERLEIIAELLNDALGNKKYPDYCFILRMPDTLLVPFLSNIIDFMNNSCLPKLDELIEVNENVLEDLEKDTDIEQKLQEATHTLKLEAIKLLDCRTAIFSFLDTLNGENLVKN